MAPLTPSAVAPARIAEYTGLWHATQRPAPTCRAAQRRCSENVPRRAATPVIAPVNKNHAAMPRTPTTLNGVIRDSKSASVTKREDVWATNLSIAEETVPT